MRADPGAVVFNDLQFRSDFAYGFSHPTAALAPQSARVLRRSQESRGYSRTSESE
jgi:hypothetical protein